MNLPWCLPSDPKRIIGGALIAVSFCLPSLVLGQSIEPITVPGTDLLRANAISHDGSTVIGRGRAGSIWSAFRWSHSSGGESLGTLYPADNNAAGEGVSADGRVIVGISEQSLVYPNTRASFRWTRETGMVDIGHLSGANLGYASGVSDNGLIACGDDSLISTGLSMGYIWSASLGFQALGDLAGGSVSSDTQAIAGDGSTVVGISSVANGHQAFRWTAPSGMVGLPAPSNGDVPANAFDVNYDGSVVVGNASVAGKLHAYRWTELGGTEDLGVGSGFTTSSAVAVSSDGEIIAVNQSPGGIRKGYLWTRSGGYRSVSQVLQDHFVNTTGWSSLSDLVDISADGQTLLGTGTYMGESSIYVAHLVPEPAYLVPFGIMVGVVALRRGTRRSNSATRV